MEQGTLEFTLQSQKNEISDLLTRTLELDTDDPLLGELYQQATLLYRQVSEQDPTYKSYV